MHEFTLSNGSLSCFIDFGAVITFYTWTSSQQKYAKKPKKSVTHHCICLEMGEKKKQIAKVFWKYSGLAYGWSSDILVIA